MLGELLKRGSILRATAYVKKQREKRERAAQLRKERMKRKAGLYVCM